MATKKVNNVTKKVEAAVKETAAAVKAEAEKKAEEVKQAVSSLAVDEKVTEDKVAEEKKTVEKKPVAKKEPVKRAAVKKEMKVNAFVEFYGKQTEEKEIVASVKKAWTKSGKKVGDIKTMGLYIKPEENAVYYVINGTNAGSVVLYQEQ